MKAVLWADTALKTLFLGESRADPYTVQFPMTAIARLVCWHGDDPDRLPLRSFGSRRKHVRSKV